MVSRVVKITNPTGLHMRPAGKLCEEAMKFSSHIEILKGTDTYNAKSMLSVLGACVKSGEDIEITCDGDDEKKALEALCKLIDSGLGE